MTNFMNFLPKGVEKLNTNEVQVEEARNAYYVPNFVAKNLLKIANLVEVTANFFPNCAVNDLVEK